MFKNYKSPDDIIYSISVGDIQSVAEQELDRTLTITELKNVEERLGDYIDWYESINLTIREVVNT